MAELRPIQDAFDGMVLPRPELRDRASLSRMLRPESWNVTPATYSELGNAAIAAAAPSKFRADLINVEPFHEGALSYPDAVSRHDVWVAVTPSEYTTVARNPRALGMAAMQTSLAKRPERTFESTDYMRGQRASRHSLESKYESMGIYLQNVLDPRNALLGRFMQAAEHPGLSQFGPELNLRMQLTNYRAILDDMLVAVGVQRKWGERPDSPERLARLASEWRIIFDRQNNRHIGNFKELTTLLIDHNNAKRAVFRHRLYETKQQLRKQGA